VIGSVGFKNFHLQAMAKKQAAVPFDTTAFGQQYGGDYSTT
jgi:hypothetical protein